ncbi:uncharacterized protein LOC109597582 isoform X2 [Aethina tumida]|uniref:uncharacterized protein LOC109597582 isoform X2 n=1 Tax=Aethina tumida TaxID=116153 RepID=UPI002147261B|nr:uncharacterized protein LOC109597582 isoform X2 [Aethina tumida]
MDTVGYLLLLSSFSIVSVYGNLVIKEIKGPNSIENGAEDVAILDCDFEASNNENNIVLKWFYNGDLEQIFQWIPPRPTVSRIGKFKDNIDAHYNVTNDKNTMYRALKLDNIQPNMSGNYTCKVSSDQSEVQMTKQLIIYEPAKSGLEMAIFPNDSTVTCTANGVFPKPEINISVIGNTTLNVDEKELISQDDDTFNITKVLIYDNSTIKENVMFVCNMTIPGTEYSTAKYLEHSIDNSAVPKLPGFSTGFVLLFVSLVFLLVK